MSISPLYPLLLQKSIITIFIYLIMKLLIISIFKFSYIIISSNLHTNITIKIRGPVITNVIWEKPNRTPWDHSVYPLSTTSTIKGVQNDRSLWIDTVCGHMFIRWPDFGVGYPWEFRGHMDSSRISFNHWRSINCDQNPPLWVPLYCLPAWIECWTKLGFPFVRFWFLVRIVRLKWNERFRVYFLITHVLSVLWQ